ncbi:5-deoxy-glucuronate isomerase [Clostridium sp.]
MRNKNENILKMEKWNITSPTEEGFHEVVIPGREDCKAAYIFRLNLGKGEKYILNSEILEMNAVLIQGVASIKSDQLCSNMSKFDSFYIPGDTKIEVTSVENCIFYIGGGIYEGIGKQFFRRFEINMPIGEIHQIHGSGVSEREVFFTLNHQVPASRLICGLTWGGEGAWTSWPPHQHENDLEEVYCYFDMPKPKFGLHLSYLKSGEEIETVAHIIRDGSMILAPRGYHPTVASPGTKNIYFWVLVSLTTKSRRYDLAINDPSYDIK